MSIPDGSRPLDLLNEFLVTGEHHLVAELGDNNASSFRQVRAPYFIDGDAPPFTIRPVTERELLTLSGERHTFVEDWLHVPTNRLMHIAYQRRNFGGELEWDEPVVFFGTHQNFVFALESRSDGGAPSVIPASKEQWNTVHERTGEWWGKALYNDEYTDFFMYGLYRLPMHYRLLSRNDYESTKGQTRSEIMAELTDLGYEYVGDIVWSDNGMTEGFRPAA